LLESIITSKELLDDMSDYLVKTTAEWDSQYRNGHWDHLKFRGERPHYSAVAERIHQYHHNGSIVDLGCGFGELWKYLYEDEKKNLWSQAIPNLNCNGIFIP